MTDIGDFIKVLNECIDENFPGTERYMIAGGDFIKDVVLELRKDKKRLRYSPYELFYSSDDYEDTIVRFMEMWETVLKD